MTEGRLKRQEGRSEEQDEQYTAPDNVGRGMPTWSKSVSIKWQDRFRSRRFLFMTYSLVHHSSAVCS